MHRTVNICGAAIGLHAMLFSALAHLEVPPKPRMSFEVEPVLLPPAPPSIPSERPAASEAAPSRGATRKRAAASRPRAASPLARAVASSEPAPPRAVEPSAPPAPDSDAGVLLSSIGRAGKNGSAIDGGLGNADGESPSVALGNAFLRGGARGAAAPPHESRAEPAQPVEDYTRLIPPYSDAAIEHDVSAAVAMRVEVDEEGRVVDASVLKGAGYGLDELALQTIKKYRFRPARDDEGRPRRAVFGWRIVWESHWKRLVTETIAGHPNCRGQGPLNLGEVHPVYIDCDAPAGYFELAPEERPPR